MDFFGFFGLGLVAGLIMGGAFVYLAFVPSLKKKIASIKQKLERAALASDEVETFKLKLEKQRLERQAAESKLKSIEEAHYTQISELETQYATAIAALEEERAGLVKQLEASSGQIMDWEQAYRDVAQELEQTKQELDALKSASTDESDLPASLEPETTADEGTGNLDLGVAVAGAAGIAAVSQLGQAEPEPLEALEEREITAEIDVDVPTSEALETTSIDSTDGLELAEEEGLDSTDIFNVGAEGKTDTMVEGRDHGFAVEEESPFNLESVPGSENPETLTQEEANAITSPFDVETREAEIEADLADWVDTPGESDIDLTIEVEQTTIQGSEFSDVAPPPDIDTADFTDLSEIVEPDVALDSSFSDLEIPEETPNDLLGESELFVETDDTESTQLPEPTLLNLEEDLNLPSDLGDTADFPKSLLADTPNPISETATEETDIDSVDDDLAFLMELQDDSFDSTEAAVLPDVGDTFVSAGLSSSELMSEGTDELSALLGESASGDDDNAWSGLLDEAADGSETDLFALLKDDASTDSADDHQRRDEELFAGLEDMLNEDVIEGRSALEDLELDSFLGEASESSSDNTTNTLEELDDLGIDSEPKQQDSE